MKRCVKEAYNILVKEVVHEDIKKQMANVVIACQSGLVRESEAIVYLGNRWQDDLAWCLVEESEGNNE